jgi:hypothetical protein
MVASATDRVAVKRRSAAIGLAIPSGRNRWRLCENTLLPRLKLCQAA